MTPSFVIVGDAMLDIAAQLHGPIAHASDSPVSISTQTGGAGANTARWLARTGVRTTLIAAIGDDAAGNTIRRDLQTDGVHPMLQVSSGTPTGACIVLIGVDGERTMLPDAGANSLLDATAVPDDILSGHLHLSGYTLLNPASREAGRRIALRARARGCTISLDPASAAPLAAAPHALDAVDGMVDVLIANLDEARVLTGTDRPDDACAALAERYPTVIVKLGAEGSIALAGTQRAMATARPVAVVDTTGAGDAFAAGFLSAWSSGLGLQEALEAATDRASSAVSRVGAGPPPHRP